jgi:hypothetical protein
MKNNVKDMVKLILTIIQNIILVKKILLENNLKILVAQIRKDIFKMAVQSIGIYMNGTFYSPKKIKFICV